MELCGACRRRPPTTPLYGTDTAICNHCRRLAVSWCWRKEQGIEESDVRPRHDTDRPGVAYLCTLCGYWHWTMHLEPPDPVMAAGIWEMTRYFTETGFHINVARGWDRIRQLRT